MSLIRFLMMRASSTMSTRLAMGQSPALWCVVQLDRILSDDLDGNKAGCGVKGHTTALLAAALTPDDRNPDFTKDPLAGLDILLADRADDLGREHVRASGQPRRQIDRAAGQPCHLA